MFVKKGNTHLNNKNKIYRLLQQHLDNQAVGFPSVESGADITLLKRLFTPDEARIALHIPYKPASLEQIVEKAASEFPAEHVERLLDSMLIKGAIGWREKNGASYWNVMPLVVGMYEHQDGEPTPDFLADMHAYTENEAFGKAFLAATPPQKRIIPINESISVEHHIATYDYIRSIVETSPGLFVVLKCVCREVMAMNEQPCGVTSRVETCLALGDTAASILRRNHGREITRDEALEILQQNENDGLVLQPTNSQKPEWVCSCCGCCCGLLRIHKSLPRPIDFWISNFHATLDTEACSRCSTCVSRCQVGAISMTGPDNSACLDMNRCIGCGLCVPACPSKAITLNKKTLETVPPLDDEALYDEIMMNKAKTLSQ